MTTKSSAQESGLGLMVFGLGVLRVERFIFLPAFRVFFEDSYVRKKRS